MALKVSKMVLPLLRKEEEKGVEIDPLFLNTQKERIRKGDEAYQKL